MYLFSSFTFLFSPYTVQCFHNVPYFLPHLALLSPQFTDLISLDLQSHLSISLHSPLAHQLPHHANRTNSSFVQSQDSTTEAFSLEKESMWIV